MNYTKNHQLKIAIITRGDFDLATLDRIAKKEDIDIVITKKTEKRIHRHIVTNISANITAFELLTREFLAGVVLEYGIRQVENIVDVEVK